jgi:restriction endonuclease S subunit
MKNHFRFKICEQRRIVAELDALQAKVAALKRLQAGPTAELEKLFQSHHHHAFTTQS